MTNECPKGLYYFPNFISDSIEEYLISEIDKFNWSNELKRRVQHYGYKYDYTKKSIDESMRVDDLCPWMKIVGQSLVKKGIFSKIPDQVIINEYLPGQGIYPHIDCQPCFGKEIVSLSLLSGCMMELTLGFDLYELYLEPKSLLVLTGESRNSWQHGIPARKKDGDKPRSRRVSATFRTVILN